MSCPTCNSQPVSSFASQYFYSAVPSTCTSTDCPTTMSTKCLWYGGPALSCSGINTGDSVELSLQKIDTKLCATLGNYASYNINCLPGPITTQKQFVEGISTFVCTLSTNFTTFSTVTYPAYQAQVNTRFLALETPGTVSTPYVGLLAGDSLQTVLGKLATRINTIHQVELDLSQVSWSSCFTVPTPPSTVGAAFSLVVDQICQIKAGGGAVVLPTFNNVGSCLVSPGSADSLSDTLGKIKTRLCQTPTLNTAQLASTCVAIPAGAQDLQNLLQNMLSQVDTLSQDTVQFSADFIESLVDPTQPCLGKTVSLAARIQQDMLVAATPTDSFPGTLVDKLEGGTGVTLDPDTVPGKILITASGTQDDHKVLADTLDATPGVLSEKLSGGANQGITISTTYNNLTGKVVVTPSLDAPALAALLMTIISQDDTLKTQLCTLIASCPSPCDTPTNIQALAVS